MILNDKQIRQLCEEENMILPWCVKADTPKGAFSSGIDSYGYDFRLDIKDAYVFNNNGRVRECDPKKFDVGLLSEIETSEGNAFVLPAKSYMLGKSVEKFNIPKNIRGLCFGKSSYARCGVFVNVTPLEPGWKGVLTIEIYNSLDVSVKIYANEGIGSLVFMQGDEPDSMYDGRYQGQTSTTFTRSNAPLTVKDTLSESIQQYVDQNKYQPSPPLVLIKILKEVTCMIILESHRVWLTPEFEYDKSLNRISVVWRWENRVIKLHEALGSIELNRYEVREYSNILHKVGYDYLYEADFGHFIKSYDWLIGKSKG